MVVFLHKVMLEGRMEKKYTPTAHIRGLAERYFSSKSLLVKRLIGMVMFTVGGATSSTLTLFFEELGFLEEEAIFIRREEKVFSEEEG